MLVWDTIAQLERSALLMRSAALTLSDAAETLRRVGRPDLAEQLEARVLTFHSTAMAAQVREPAGGWRGRV